MLLETVRLAWQAIFRNALRFIAHGAWHRHRRRRGDSPWSPSANGTTEKVKADLARLGSNLLFLQSGQFGPGRASSDAKPSTRAISKRCARN